MAIFYAETGAFSGSPKCGFLESPKHARNSVNSQGNPPITGGNFLGWGPEFQNNLDPSNNNQDYEIDIPTGSNGNVVYDVSTGTIGIQDPSSTYDFIVYLCTTPLSIVHQSDVISRPGIYSWALEFQYATADGGFNAAPIPITLNDFGICGLPKTSPYTGSLMNPIPPSAFNTSTSSLGSYTVPYPYPGAPNITVLSGTIDSRTLLGARTWFTLYADTDWGDLSPYSPANGYKLIPPSFGLYFSYLSSPYFTTQPSSQSVTHPTGTSFVVVAMGYPSVSYQWQVSSNSGVSWSNITAAGTPGYSGYTTATLTIATTATAMNGYYYRCVGSEPGGNTNSSNAAILTVT